MNNKTDKLLSRTEFRESVFARDKHKCVVCGVTDVPLDAHHILERRLWSDGGYYISNGATVCEEHHRLCESTDISVEQIREYAGIVKPIIPDHLYEDQLYDKWGNAFLPNGQRLRGELFWDQSVQKVISKHLSSFTNKVKYPRTYHLPWSDNMNDDDRMISSLDQFLNKEVVVTVKMDGENTTMYNDYIHARSIDGRNHVSRNWVKNFHSTISHEIPEDWRICGENLFAKHSIEYNDLDTYFHGFSIWNQYNECLSWDETLLWFELIGIEPVKELYRGIFDEKKIRSLYDNSKWNLMEGYVVRNVNQFAYKDFRNNVGKYVRKDHIQTIKHWMHGQPVIQNKLKK
jgi:RNA ligase